MWRPERRRAPAVSLRQAVLLGLLHGPAEILPVSSSAHTIAVPWLLGWSYRTLDAETRKSFEVALHAGSLLGVATGARGLLAELGTARLGLIGRAAVAPALAGLWLQRPIIQRLGRPGTIAAGLAGGSLLMALADRAPERRSASQTIAADAWWLGAAQAVALIPGVSRHGAATATGRLRGFRRPDAYLLSRQAGLAPVAGATLLRSVRILRSGLPGPVRAGFAGGAAAAFASTLAGERLVRAGDGNRPLWPFAVYRIGLAALIAARVD